MTDKILHETLCACHTHIPFTVYIKLLFSAILLRTVIVVTVIVTEAAKIGNS